MLMEGAAYSNHLPSTGSIEDVLTSEGKLSLFHHVNQAMIHIKETLNWFAYECPTGYKANLEFNQRLVNYLASGWHQFHYSEETSPKQDANNLMKLVEMLPYEITDISSQTGRKQESASKDGIPHENIDMSVAKEIQVLLEEESGNCLSKGFSIKTVSGHPHRCTLVFYQPFPVEVIVQFPSGSYPDELPVAVVTKQLFHPNILFGGEVSPKALKGRFKLTNLTQYSVRNVTEVIKSLLVTPDSSAIANPAAQLRYQNGADAFFEAAAVEYEQQKYLPEVDIESVLGDLVSSLTALDMEQDFNATTELTVAKCLKEASTLMRSAKRYCLAELRGPPEYNTLVTEPLRSMFASLHGALGIATQVFSTMSVTQGSGGRGTLTSDSDVESAPSVVQARSLCEGQPQPSQPPTSEPHFQTPDLE